MSLKVGDRVRIVGNRGIREHLFPIGSEGVITYIYKADRRYYVEGASLNQVVDAIDLELIPTTNMGASIKPDLSAGNKTTDPKFKFMIGDTVCNRPGMGGMDLKGKVCSRMVDRNGIKKYHVIWNGGDDYWEFEGLLIADSQPDLLDSLKYAGCVEYNSCNHSWKDYTGLTDSFTYCEHCDEKKKEV